MTNKRHPIRCLLLADSTRKTEDRRDRGTIAGARIAVGRKCIAAWERRRRAGRLARNAHKVRRLFVSQGSIIMKKILAVFALAAAITVVGC